MTIEPPPRSTPEFGFAWMEWLHRLYLAVKSPQDLVQSITVTGAVPKGVRSLELAHDSTPIAATIANTLDHPGFFIVKNTSSAGTEAHTLTLTVGTFDGSLTVATLNAPDEALVVYFDSAGNGTIIENIGSVGLA